jgi:short-subunit dehydrogenase
MRLKPLVDQVIVITGASSGIGLVTARMGATAGARVFLIARDAATLADLVAQIRAEGGEADFAVADVGDRAALRSAAAVAVARFGRIDTWVNNAGVAIYAPLLETPADEHERLFRTNYFGTVHGTQVAIEQLAGHGGALITIGSVAGDMPSPMMGAYAASKHAIHAFIASLRIELKAQGAPVSITLIKPSGMATPIARHAANHQDGEAMIPPPPYDPELVAGAILHAATHPVRDLTVGGVGLAQVLFASHFPALFERLAPLVVPFLSDRSKPPTRNNNLAAPVADGYERSADESGRATSIYTIARRHPAMAIGLIGAAGALGWLVTGRCRER